MANIPQEQKLEERFSRKISDDINCSICLDILVLPQTIVPCGHSFCRSCCSSDSRQQVCFTTCPQCRQSVEGIVPSRQLESLIETLVTVPNLLFKNDDDKQHFLTRMKTENEKKSEINHHFPGRSRKRRCGYAQNYAPVSNPRTRIETLNNAYHASQSVRVAFQSGIASGTTIVGPTIRAASYDPMSAPLPPPYDFTATGPVPVLRFSGPTITSSNVSRNRARQTVRSTDIADHCLAQGGAVGVSASDPICID